MFDFIENFILFTLDVCYFSLDILQQFVFIPKISYQKLLKTELIDEEYVKYAEDVEEEEEEEEEEDEEEDDDEDEDYVPEDDDEEEDEEEEDDDYVPEDEEDEDETETNNYISIDAKSIEDDDDIDLPDLMPEEELEPLTEAEIRCFGFGGGESVLYNELYNIIYRRKTPSPSIPTTNAPSE